MGLFRLLSDLFPACHHPKEEMHHANVAHAAREALSWPGTPAQHRTRPSTHFTSLHFTHLGQHPTAVSPASNENCTGQPPLPSAVAVHALLYPAGHARPGE